MENPLLYKARMDTMETMINEDWALIAIRSPEDPELLSGLDQARNTKARGQDYGHGSFAGCRRSAVAGSCPYTSPGPLVL